MTNSETQTNDGIGPSLCECPFCSVLGLPERIDQYLADGDCDELPTECNQ